MSYRKLPLGVLPLLIALCWTPTALAQGGSFGLGNPGGGGGGGGSFSGDLSGSDLTDSSDDTVTVADGLAIEDGFTGVTITNYANGALRFDPGSASNVSLQAGPAGKGLVISTDASGAGSLFLSASNPSASISAIFGNRFALTGSSSGVQKLVTISDQGELVWTDGRADNGSEQISLNRPGANQFAIDTAGTTRVLVNSTTNLELRNGFGLGFATGVPGSGIDARIVRTGTNTVTLDDGSGGAATLSVATGSFGGAAVTINTSGVLMNASGILRFSGDTVLDRDAESVLALKGDGDADAAVRVYQDDSSTYLGYTSLTSSPDTTVPTFSALPTGGTASQVGWIQIDVNGTTSYVPYWQ